MAEFCSGVRMRRWRPVVDACEVSLKLKMSTRPEVQELIHGYCESSTGSELTRARVHPASRTCAEVYDGSG